MMKPALTTTTTILGCILAAGLASAQSPSVIQNTRNTMNTVSNNATAASNEALGVHQSAPAAASATHASAKSRGVAASEEQVVPDGKYAANGRRDPFISPVVSHAGGSGCNTGKKCLEIGAINLRGVVRAESGFIAVVSNGLNKAYFLRENDPVFNGYVVKITGDSVVFQETLQDRLGKSFTREVVKKITTPAV